MLPSLQALVPVTVEVEVPFDLHRYIIGQKGSGIRKMMDEFEVSCCPSHLFCPGESLSDCVCGGGNQLQHTQDCHGLTMEYRGRNKKMGPVQFSPWLQSLVGFMLKLCHQCGCFK